MNRLRGLKQACHFGPTLIVTAIAFGFANQTNYRHSIRTRHNPLAPISGVVGNNIDFYVDIKKADSFLVLDNLKFWLIKIIEDVRNEQKINAPKKKIISNNNYV